MHLTLAFNPSHLEIVNPVVEGSVRARQHRRRDTEGKQVLPVLIHGDAAFAGQGVVMETLNLSGTRGYGTGGTVHIIINNQIGFTTSDPRDTRSTLYCTDVAKMVECPIFHVNGDDPDAVVMVTEIALDFRMQFGKDVVVDVVCYRRQGHNEQDEPLVTQPLMYKKIAKHPSTRKLYAERLEREGVIREGEGDEMVKAYRQTLEAGEHTNKFVLFDHKPAFAVNWQPYIGTEWTLPAATGMPLADLTALARGLTTIPPEFKLQSRVEKIIADRKAMGEGRLPLDWGMAENLAYASLLKEGYPVRLSGQDSGRGTFFHRHAVLHDQNRERWDDGTFIPLQHVSEGQADFLVIDSVLSEEAVLGFEYGYATGAPDELVIWEAQFGDFANGAQVVVDQFISSGEAKWGRLCGLVMMLPHGFEGQGPEHSSARLERYLQLCAQYNMQVVVPSTPAQMYHMLRRQMLRAHRKPLIVMTPKSMLRHKESVSSLEDLAQGPVSDGDRRAGKRRSKRGPAAHPVQRQGLLRPSRATARARHGNRRDRPCRAALSVSARRLAGAGRSLRQGNGSDVGAGGARQSGRLASHPTLSPAPHACRPGPCLCAAAVLGGAGGGVARAPQPAAEGTHGGGLRTDRRQRRERRAASVAEKRAHRSCLGAKLIEEKTC